MPKEDFTFKTINTRVDRLPLGLRPRIIHVNARIIEITEAIHRSALENKACPVEWIDELVDLNTWTLQYESDKKAQDKALKSI